MTCLRTRLLTLTGALALAALAAPGGTQAGNLADITQVGDHQSVQVTQDGGVNYAGVVQGRSALPNVPGAGRLERQFALPQWDGPSEANDISIEQDGYGNGVLATQAGHGNDIAIEQDGFGNGALLSQAGRNNTLTVTQRNGFNFAAVTQNGEDLRAVVHQRGGIVTQLQQDNSGTRGSVNRAFGLPIEIESQSTDITVRQTNVWSSR
jgi:hypothetical protein